MKKIVAIVLLGAHLMMLGGYTLLFDYFINKSDTEIVNRMYSGKPGSAKLIEMKVPVHMPTIEDWHEYVNVVGQIQLKDGFYNYVAIKMSRDTMSLLCLPNHEKDQLVKANVIIAKDLNGNLPLSKKGATPLTKKASTGYDNVYQIIRCDYKPLAAQVKPIYGALVEHHDNPYIESPGKPPNFSS